MKGVGSVYQRGSKYWVKFYRNGRPVRMATGATTMTAARAFLAKQLGGKEATPKARKARFEDLAALIITDYKVNQRRSLKSSLVIRLKHLGAFFGGMRAIDITTAKVKEYVAQRIEAGSANGSINLDLAALSVMFRLGRETGIVHATPLLKKLKAAQPRQGFVNPDKFLALLDCLPADLKDPVEFLYRTGWRRNEMAKLEWSDVDFTAGEIHLRPELSKNDEGRVFPLRGALLALMHRAHARRHLGTQRVFHIGGKPLGQFRKAWKRATIDAKLADLIVHDLRRSAVRNMMKAEISEHAAMKLSGHKTRTIFEHYDIISGDELKRASDKLETFLSGETATLTKPRKTERK